MSDIQPYKGEFRLIDGDGDGDQREILAENLGGGDTSFRLSDLARVTWPGAGDDRFVVKAPSGERRETEFVGVVLAQMAPRKFYTSAYQQGGDDYPDCTSPDGVRGEVSEVWAEKKGPDGEVTFSLPDGKIVNFGGDCASCPMSEWGSAMLLKPDRQTRAQACSERRHLLFQPVNARKPVIIDAPPTALSAWRAFGLDMYDLGLRLSRTVIRFTLSAKSGETAQLQASIAGTITPEQTAKIRALMPDTSRSPAPQLAPPPADPPPTDEQPDDGAEPF